MKKLKEQNKTIKEDIHPKTYNLLQDLQELLADREEYRP